MRWLPSAMVYCTLNIILPALPCWISLYISMNLDYIQNCGPLGIFMTVLLFNCSPVLTDARGYTGFQHLELGNVGFNRGLNQSKNEKAPEVWKRQTMSPSTHNQTPKGALKLSNTTKHFLLHNSFALHVLQKHTVLLKKGRYYCLDPEGLKTIKT